MKRIVAFFNSHYGIILVAIALLTTLKTCNLSSYTEHRQKEYVQLQKEVLSHVRVQDSLLMELSSRTDSLKENLKLRKEVEKHNIIRINISDKR